MLAMTLESTDSLCTSAFPVWPFCPGYKTDLAGKELQFVE
jgi:hypothetical protein